MSAPEKTKDAHARAIEAAWNAYLTGEHGFALETPKQDAAFPYVWKQLSK